MSVKHETKLCRPGAYYLVVLVAVIGGGCFRQLNLLMLLGCLLAGPFMFSLIYGRIALRRLRVGRQLPAQLGAGQRMIVDLGVTNQRSWFPIWAVEVEDRVERQNEDALGGKPVAVGVFFPRVGAGETRVVSYQGRLNDRGLYRFGALRLSTRFPIGLVRHTLVLDQHDSLLVLPRLGQLAHDWSDTIIHESDRGQTPLARRGLLEGDYFGLRDWRQGDPRRWIHWRTTARRGSLVVRQFEQRRSQDLAILVDLWQSPEAEPKQVENVETAVRLVATLAEEAHRKQGRHVTLCVAARNPMFHTGPASPAMLHEQMNELALTIPHHEDALPPLLARAVGRLNLATPILLISTRPIELVDFQKVISKAGLLVSNRVIHVISIDGELTRYYHEQGVEA